MSIEQAPSGMWVAATMFNNRRMKGMGDTKESARQALIDLIKVEKEADKRRRAK